MYLRRDYYCVSQMLVYYGVSSKHDKEVNMNIKAVLGKHLPSLNAWFDTTLNTEQLTTESIQLFEQLQRLDLYVFYTG